MLEWLSSKMAVMLASMLLLSAATACFLNGREFNVRQEIEMLSRAVADFVDDALRLHGATLLTVTYGGDGDLVLPNVVDGRQYQLTLRRDSVMIEQLGVRAIGYWSGELHLWTWSGGPLSQEVIDELDSTSPSLSLASGQPWRVAVKPVTVSGIDVLLAFASSSR